MNNPYIGFVLILAVVGIVSAVSQASLTPLWIVALLAFMLKPFLPPRD